MATIEVTSDRDGLSLFVRCFEPMTKFFGTAPPYDRVLLEGCVEVCSGASLQLVDREHIPHPMDFGDERFDFVLEPTVPNITALGATGFEWSEEASEAVATIAVSEATVQLTREQALVRIRERQAEDVELFRRRSERGRER